MVLGIAWHSIDAAEKAGASDKGSTSESPGKGKISVPFKYPVVPGTLQWTQRVLTETPWQLCQIPRDILTNLTDQALLLTVLHYPLRGDISAFDSSAKGLEVTIGRFNGLPEFLSRPRIPHLLKEHFMTLRAEQFESKGYSVENQGSIDLGYIAELLLHPKILPNLREQDRYELCGRALRLQADIRDRFGRSASEYPAARIAAIMLGSGVELEMPTRRVLFSDIFPGRTISEVGERGFTSEAEDKLYEIGHQLSSSPKAAAPP
jgi:hypothetical protein